jgi:hypothetical protein
MISDEQKINADNSHIDDYQCTWINSIGTKPDSGTCMVTPLIRAW